MVDSSEQRAILLEEAAGAARAAARLEVAEGHLRELVDLLGADGTATDVAARARLASVLLMAQRNESALAELESAVAAMGDPGRDPAGVEVGGQGREAWSCRRRPWLPRVGAERALQGANPRPRRGGGRRARHPRHGTRQDRRRRRARRPADGHCRRGGGGRPRHGAAGAEQLPGSPWPMTRERRWRRCAKASSSPRPWASATSRSSWPRWCARRPSTPVTGAGRWPRSTARPRPDPGGEPHQSARDRRHYRRSQRPVTPLRAFEAIQPLPPETDPQVVSGIVHARVAGVSGGRLRRCRAARCGGGDRNVRRGAGAPADTAGEEAELWRGDGPRRPLFSISLASLELSGRATEATAGTLRAGLAALEGDTDPSAFRRAREAWLDLGLPVHHALCLLDGRRLLGDAGATREDVAAAIAALEPRAWRASASRAGWRRSRRWAGSTRVEATSGGRRPATRRPDPLNAPSRPVSGAERGRTSPVRSAGSAIGGDAYSAAGPGAGRP